MPYISKTARTDLEGSLAIAFAEQPVGELNYVITSFLIDWFDENGISYTNINAAIGVLECAKLELYRRLAAPYEDKKIIENGDVYNG